MFEDLFSKQARAYAQYRPQYPPELFAYLAGLAPGRVLAWDCGTGSGQAALGLAGRFDRVAATDASLQQIDHARRHPRILYINSRAEQACLAASAADLVTVAQAVHWFDLDPFYAEVRRVLKPGGVLAVWCYHLTEISPQLDRLMARYYFDIVGPYWSPRLSLVDDFYRTLPFPFEELPAPGITLEESWTLNELLGFLWSWSATHKYIEARRENPLELIHPQFEAAWGPPPQKHRIRWPLYFRIGVSK